MAAAPGLFIHRRWTNEVPGAWLILLAAGTLSVQNRTKRSSRAGPARDPRVVTEVSSA